MATWSLFPSGSEQAMWYSPLTDGLCHCHIIQYPVDQEPLLLGSQDLSWCLPSWGLVILILPSIFKNLLLLLLLLFWLLWVFVAVHRLSLAAAGISLRMTRCWRDTMNSVQTSSLSAPHYSLWKLSCAFIYLNILWSLVKCNRHEFINLLNMY